MTIPCKPEAGLIIEANALYLLNIKSQGSIMWSDLTGKTRVSLISWCPPQDASVLLPIISSLQPLSSLTPSPLPHLLLCQLRLQACNLGVDWGWGFCVVSGHGSSSSLRRKNPDLEILYQAQSQYPENGLLLEWNIWNTIMEPRCNRGEYCHILKIC